MQVIKRENKKDDVIYFDEIDSYMYVLMQSKEDKNFCVVNNDYEILSLRTIQKRIPLEVWDESLLNSYDIFAFKDAINFEKKLLKLLKEKYE
jgi:hypothetical protein